MDEELEDLKRRFIERAKSAKQLDSELGRELWCLLVTHDWFETQLNNRVCDLVRRWGGNLDDVKEMKQDVILQLRLDMHAKPTLGLNLEQAPQPIPSKLWRVRLRTFLTGCGVTRSVWQLDLAAFAAAKPPVRIGNA